MGNKLVEASGSKKSDPIKSLEDFLILQNTELSNRINLSDASKSFRTFQFSVRTEGNLIVKVNINIKFKAYLKREAMDLSLHAKNFDFLMKKFRLSNFPNILPYMKTMNFEKNDEDFVMVFRQGTYSTLLDRLHDLPALKLIEQMFIITQCIVAIYCLHEENLYHGDISSSNVLLTSYNHVLVSDIASFKPYYLDDANYSIYQNFYAHSTVQKVIQKCTVAPEKFVENNERSNYFDLAEIDKNLLSSLQKMDMFSLGCLIAETFLNGENLFTYETLQKYRKGDYDPRITIEKIQNTKIVELVENLIQIDPEKRMTAKDVLQFWFGLIVFKYNLEFVYYLDSALFMQNFCNPDIQIALISKMIPFIYSEIIKVEAPNLVENLPLPIHQIDILGLFSHTLNEIKINIFQILTQPEPKYFSKEFLAKNLKNSRIDEQIDICTHFQNSENLVPQDLKHIIDQYNQKNHKTTDGEKKKKKSEKKSFLFMEDPNNLNIECETLTIIIHLICNSLRNCSYSQSKLAGIEIIQNLSQFTNDSQKLHLICPNLSALFYDPLADEQDPMVISSAFATFCNVLSLMKNPFEQKTDCILFRKFIWENISEISKSKEPIIQTVFAENFHIISDICKVMLTQTFSKNAEFDPNNITFKQEIEGFRTDLLNYIKTSFIGNPEMQEILLKNLHFIIQKDIFDVETFGSDLLPLIFSCFNKTIPLKLACIKLFPKIMNVLSEKDIYQMLYPCLEFCLYHNDELIILNAIKCFTKITKKTQESKIVNFESIIEKIMPLTLYPNKWIREAAINYIKVILEKFSPVDLYCYIQPKMVKYFTENIMLNSELLDYVIPPSIEKNIFDFYKTNRDLNKLKKENDFVQIFYENFIKKTSAQKTFSNVQSEELKDFNKHFSELAQEGIPIDFAHRINNFFINCHINKIFYILEMDIYNDKKEYKASEKKNLAKTFLQTHYIDVDMNEVSGHTELLLRQMETFIKNNGIYYLQKLNNDNTVISLSTFTLLQNCLLMINNFLIKFGQMQIKKNISFGGFADFSSKNQNYLKTWKPSGVLVTTIFEHTDVVSSINSSCDSRFFVSGSYDGTIRLFDIEKIENDFTSESIASIICEGENPKKQKIKCLKFLKHSHSVIAGTDKGLLDIYRFDYLDNSKKQRSVNLRRYNAKGEIKDIESFKVKNDNIFAYITSLGEMGIEDIRCKNSILKVDFGKERGILTNLVLNPNAQTAYIGTLNGYILTFDLRCCLISNIFQLFDYNNQSIPIISLNKFYNFQTSIPDLPEDNELIALSFGSNNHEFCVFDLNSFQENINPLLYFVSTNEENALYRIPFLKNFRKQESFSNFNNKYSERFYYEDIYRSYIFNRADSLNDVINFLSDPLMISQNSIKEKWLVNSRNSYSNISNFFSYKNCSNKIISLPEIKLTPAAQKNMDNFLLSCGNDKKIRYLNFNFSGIPEEKKENVCKFPITGMHVNNSDKKERAYTMSKSGKVHIIHEFIKTNAKKKDNLVINKIDEKAMHKDFLTDICILDREKYGLIVTSSRDNTIKIWK